MQPRFAALLFALGLVDLAIVNLGLAPRVFADTEAVTAQSSLPTRVADVEAPPQPSSTTPAQRPEARRELPPPSSAPPELPPVAAPSAVPLQPGEPAPAQPPPAEPAPAEPTPAERAPALAARWAQPDPLPEAVADVEGAHTSTIDVTVAFPEAAAALLTPEARGELLRLAARMRDDTSHRLRIVGHADARGSREFNRFLGNRRARVVSELLVAAGVPREQIEIESRGEEQPLELGASEEAWAANRRVEISIGNEGSNTP